MMTLKEAKDELARLLATPKDQLTQENYRWIGELQYGVIPQLEKVSRGQN